MALTPWDIGSEQLSAMKASVDNSSGGVGAFGLQGQNGGTIGNFFTGEDPTAHNEAVYNWQRSESSAEKADQRSWMHDYYQAAREDNQFQRKLADMQAAGFSPLSALESSGSYAGSYSASAAQGASEAAKPRSNGLGGILTSVIGALALIASKGISASAGAAKAAADASRSTAAADLFKSQTALNLAKLYGSESVIGATAAKASHIAKLKRDLKFETDQDWRDMFHSRGMKAPDED